MEHKRFHTIFANPYFLNGVTWISVWLIYQLRWSDLCPELSAGLTFFLLATSAISLIIGVLSNKKGSIPYQPLDYVKLSPLYSSLAILWMLFIIEVAAAGGIPLLSYLSGSLKLTYKDFGLPVVNVLVVNGFSALALFAFYAYKSISDKKKRKSLLLIILSACFPFILMFNRGAIMANIIAFFIIALIISPRPGRLILKSIAAILILLFGFGAMGNIRFGRDNLDNTILKIGEASKSFTESGIPSEFFWTYLYIASPLANTQYTINRSQWGESDSEDVQNFIVYELTPEIISKRIAEERNPNRLKQVTPALTVGSVYGRPYNYLGWTGLWLTFGFLLFFIFINTHIISKKSRYYIPLIISLDLVVVLNLFDNMLTFMGLVPQLLIFIILYWCSLLRRHH